MADVNVLCHFKLVSSTLFYISVPCCYEVCLLILLVNLYRWGNVFPSLDMSKRICHPNRCVLSICVKCIENRIFLLHYVLWTLLWDWFPDEFTEVQPTMSTLHLTNTVVLLCSGKKAKSISKELQLLFGANNLLWFVSKFRQYITLKTFCKFLIHVLHYHITPRANRQDVFASHFNCNWKMQFGLKINGLLKWNLCSNVHNTFMKLFVWKQFMSRKIAQCS